MGDIADAIIAGFLCQQCGEVVDDDETGYPRTCAGCQDAEFDDEPDPDPEDG